MSDEVWVTMDADPPKERFSAADAIQTVAAVLTTVEVVAPGAIAKGAKAVAQRVTNRRPSKSNPSTENTAEE